jgi:hypothetical protein
MIAVSHGDRAHAALGASSCYRWTACPGSIRLSAGLESKSSAYAEEGTAAHELAEVCLRNGQDAIEWVDRKLPVKYGHHYVDGDMAEAVQVYIDYVRTHILAGDEVQIEHRFDLSSLGVGVPMFGTADAVIYMPAYRKLIVADYKHGAGIAVEAVGNQQLRYYALGSLLSMPDAAVDSISMVVVQPRAWHPDGPIRSENITSYDLAEWSAELVEAAKRTLEPDAPLSVGDHCRFCPARVPCPAQRERAVEVIEAAGAPLPPETLTPAELAAVLDKQAQLGAVVAWYKAVEAHAYSLAVNGTPVPGYKLVQGRQGNKSWVDEDDAALALELAGVASEDMWIRKLVTPAAAEKLVDKKAAKDLEQYIHRKPGAPALVPESDKRRAIECGATADFVAITSE